MKNEERKVGGSSTPPTTTHCELDDLDGLDRSKSDDFAQATIERCPHDGENPFAQISRDLIRNKTISLECRMLIIYLLSMSDKRSEEHTSELQSRQYLVCSLLL